LVFCGEWEFTNNATCRFYVGIKGPEKYKFNITHPGSLNKLAAVHNDCGKLIFTSGKSIAIKTIPKSPPRT
jgi:hypothetical protein